MKIKGKIIAAAVAVCMSMLTFQTAFAGNEDRVGESGANELMINPWARSSGWGGVGVACTRGLEAIYTNVAGAAFTPKTELIFSHTMWLKGSDVNINTFGISQKVGETGVLSLGVMSMSFGEVPITTTELPEGGIGTFSPSLMNINVAYSKMFSNSIYGGINFKVVSQKISNLSAQGIAIDAGIQYITGEMENIMFGISLKNVGPRMKFNGDGLSFRGFLPGASNQITFEQRSAEFELPTSLNIGAAYLFNISDKHKLTAAATFISNSFAKDQYIVGLEYKMMEYLMLRGAYTYEKGITSNSERTTVLTGPSGGLSVQVPFGKEKTSSFAIDYSYRATNPFQGTHSIGARINL